MRMLFSFLVLPIVAAMMALQTRTPLFSRHQPGGLFTIENVVEHPGSIFFVHSVTGTDGAGYGRNPDAPLATIDYALGLCTANKGDVIYVLPGHVETISGAATLALDKAGVAVIGLGRGADRPTLTFSATGSNIAVSGAGSKFKNFLITNTGVIDVTAGITVTGADCELVDIEARESGATSQFVDFIIVDTGGDRCLIENLRFLGAAGDAGASGISIIAAVDGVRIVRPDIDGTLSAGCVENVTAATTNCTIDRPLLRNRHATQDGGIVMHANATGSALSPRIRSATNDADGFNLAVVFAKGQVFDPLVVNADGERAGAWGTASAA